MMALDLGATMKAGIAEATAPLVGLPLWRWTRAADLAAFQFGQRIQVLGRQSNPKQVGDFALHVQCAWRVTRGERVLAGSRDLYYPAELSVVEPFPEAEWDTQPNRLEALMRELFEHDQKAFMVHRVDVGRAGALSILMEEDVSLDILPHDSLGDEYWRLFRPSIDQAHFVVTGSGIRTD